MFGRPLRGLRRPQDAVDLNVEPVAGPVPCTVTVGSGVSLSLWCCGIASPRRRARNCAISLLAEVYAPDGPVEELFDLACHDAVRDHLLDHAVAAAHTRKPRPHGCRPCSPETAERTLRHLAARLTEEDTRP